MVIKVLVEALLRLVGRVTSGSWTSGVNTWPQSRLSIHRVIHTPRVGAAS
jgi:hypothetical protein